MEEIYELKKNLEAKSDKIDKTLTHFIRLLETLNFTEKPDYQSFI